MTAYHSHPDYPLQVTDDEARAGFGSVVLFRLVRPDLSDRWTPVVAKVLSSSDVVVKIEMSPGFFVYGHKRHGWMVSPFIQKTTPVPEWNPIGFPYRTFEEAIFEAELGASEVDSPKIKGTPAEIRRPEQ